MCALSTQHQSMRGKNMHGKNMRGKREKLEMNQEEISLKMAKDWKGLKGRYNNFLTILMGES